jgi:hypothetical protein
LRVDCFQYFVHKISGVFQMKCAALTRSATIVVALLCASIIGSLSAKTAGKFSYKGALEDYNNDTIMVNDTMLAMSEKIFGRMRVFADTLVDTPSIMFVIDNSGSMGPSAPYSDTNGNRYTVTSAYIDSVMKKYPSAEIGLSVFGTYLYFDTTDRDYFVTCPRQANGAYVPLLTLNRTYPAFGNMTGYQILKEILDTAYYSGTRGYVSLSYQPTNTNLRTAGTNITAGFDAAKHAMSSAVHAKASQYIIFLSDGNANQPSARAEMYRWVRGDSTPTTYTVFFTFNNVVPAQIDTMTQNIRVNGYSSSNPRTNFWGFYNTTFQNLMNFLMTNVFNTFSSPKTGIPLQITSGTETVSIGTDSAFHFNRLFPLTGRVTPFNFTLKYQLQRNSTILKDTSYNVRFQVLRNPSTLLDSRFETKFWNRDLAYRYNNATITTVTEAMDSLDIRFNHVPGTANYLYTNARARLYTVRAPSDTETYTLTAGTGFYSTRFKRSVSGAPVPGNGTLEHAAINDTIVALFNNSENPLLPLDTLRLPIPIAIRNLRVVVNNDTMRAGDTLPIPAFVISPPSDTIRDRSILDNITWAIVPPLLAGDQLIAASVRDSTKLTATVAWRTVKVVATLSLPNSGIFASDTGDIWVTPAQTHHLVIEASNEPRTVSPNSDNPLGGKSKTIYFASSQQRDSGWAVLRDRFGNYVSFSTQTRWGSSDTSIVTAQGGNAATGEGIVIRTGPAGTARVGALDVPNTLRDSVTVIVSDVSYDRLRIMVDSGLTLVQIENLIMRSDQDTLLHVVGRRTFDSAWVPVNGDWRYIATLGSASLNGQPVWRFAPGDSGRGVIIVTFLSAIPDTVTVRILPGPPVSMVLYADTGKPGATNMQLPDPIQLIPVIAGTAYKMVAKVFDWRGVYLPEYELTGLQDSISWTAASRRGDNLASQLQTQRGAVERFMPTRAYDSVFVIALFQYDATHRYLDTVQLKIEPGPGNKIILERSAVIDRNIPNPCDTIVIPGDEMTGRCFAILRDAFNNFVGYAAVRTWDRIDPAIIDAQKGDTTIGEGIAVKKADSGMTRMFAIDSNNFKDTCVVILVPYSIVQLRIIAGKDTIPLDHDTLVMNTNQDTTLYVQGLRSDNSQWINVSAVWWISPDLRVTPVAPSNNHSWRFSPSDTGRGWIKTTLGAAIPDSLPVRFTQGPAMRVEIEIITPPDRRIAGEPIQAVVRIYDRDNNLVRGTFPVDTAAYFDTLGRGGVLRPRPFIIVGGDTLWLDAQPWDWGRQTFASGLDTVTMKLYYAPYTNNITDSLHQIFVRLQVERQSLIGASQPFKLLPGPLAEIVLEHPNGTKIPDTVYLNYPDGYINPFSFGYDRFGNRIGQIKSDWNATNGNWTLNPWQSVVSVYFSTSTIKQSESGRIIAVKDSAGTVLSDSVLIIVTGPAIKFVRAITGDVSGNGYLDRMTLIFGRAVTLPKDFAFDSLIIRYQPANGNGVDTWVVDSIQNNTGRSDSVWILALRENTSARNPGAQTAWTPTVTLSAEPKEEIAGVSLVSTDGAGPVILSAVKQLDKGNSRQRDVVTITWSEPIKRSDGGSISTSCDPAAMFYTWRVHPDDPGDTSRFELLPAMLTGIANLDAGSDQNHAVFRMTNGNDLTHNHWVNFDTLTKYVIDLSPLANMPNDNNQKVQVVVRGNPEGPVIPIPNPFRPTLVIPSEGPGIINIIHNPNAKDWVKTIGGTLLRFDVRIPINPEIDINCLVKIYDVVGNIVQSASGRLYDGLNRKQVDTLDLAQTDIFWNGTNEKGMVVASNVYRVVVYITYKYRGSARDVKVPDPQRKITTVGVKR